MGLKGVFFFCLGVVYCFGSNQIGDLSIEEKVGQVLMVHFHGEEVNEDAKILVQETKVGGIIYYNWSNGLTSPGQVEALSEGLQKLAKANSRSIPLLIAVDQEGGVVARLESGFTCFPGNRALGETGDPFLAELAALAIGRELQAVGINMNLAPVVDVNSNPRNPVIGVRSFGEDPETVIAFGKKSLDGFRQAHVVATLKHFPGYGDVGVDPHEDLPVIRKTKEELERCELLPFAKLASSADAIMTAHILVPSLDAENCSTLSEKTLNYLREEIGFEGVIVADSLVMDGVLKKCKSVDEASIRALNAGCDLLILGGKLLFGEHAGFELTAADVQRIHSSIVEAVKSGRIPVGRLDEATVRVLRLKERCIAPKQERLFALDHHALAQKISERALKVSLKKPRMIQDLGSKVLYVVAPEILEPSLQASSFFSIGKSTISFFYRGLNPSISEIEGALKGADGADVIVVCSYNAWKNPSAIALTEGLLGIGKPLIFLCLRDPLDVTLFPDANLIFTSFSPTAPSIEVICERLKALK